MFEIAPLADVLGTALIGISIIVLVYAISTSLVSDETLFDRTRLPEKDPRRLAYMIEPADGEAEPFPTVFDDAEVYLSLIVPAYNEESRLPMMLEDTLRYLKSREVVPEFTWEIIVIDDGSKDGTADLVCEYGRRDRRIRLLRQPVNMGKGAAIQAGSLHARGQMLLMVDADAATKIDDFAELERKMLELQERNREVIVVGSRAHLEGVSKAQRTGIRSFLGLGFHMLVTMSGVHGVEDTQCGFKLFSREAAQWLFPNQHIQRWCFDPELLVIGHKRHMEIAEIAVEWQEIEGSKIRVSSMIKMAIDLVQIGIFHRVGLWTVRMKGATYAV